MSVRFPIEAGGVLTFARALGYEDFTDVVPPTYLQAINHLDPDFWVRPRPGQPWVGDNDAVPTSDGAPPKLHAEQHYAFHAPIRVGDVLVRTDGESRTWTKQGRRGGELTFVETVQEFRREDDGELVATARKVVVQTARVPEVVS